MTWFRSAGWSANAGVHESSGHAARTILAVLSFIAILLLRCCVPSIEKRPRNCNPVLDLKRSSLNINLNGPKSGLASQRPATFGGATSRDSGTYMREESDI